MITSIVSLGASLGMKAFMITSAASVSWAIHFGKLKMTVGVGWG